MLSVGFFSGNSLLLQPRPVCPRSQRDIDHWPSGPASPLSRVSIDSQARTARFGILIKEIVIPSKLELVDEKVTKVTVKQLDWPWWTLIRGLIDREDALLLGIVARASTGLSFDSDPTMMCDLSGRLYNVLLKSFALSVSNAKLFKICLAALSYSSICTSAPSRNVGWPIT